MLRRFLLKLSDTRLRAALETIEECGDELGDLAAAPANAAAVFGPLRERLARAAAEPPASAAGTKAAGAAEDLLVRLEKFFADLALHKTVPDAPMKEAMLRLQKACAAAPALLSGNRRDEALARTRALCASAARTLSLAMTASSAARGDFPANLKFSSMYSGLDAVFSAFARCADALHEA